MGMGKIASCVGKGLAAGLVGTAGITASQMAEMKLRHRPESTAPAKAAEEILHIKPESEEAEQRLSQMVHFGYGTSWGAVRGLIGAAGLRGWPADLLHFAAVFGTALVMLPALKLAPPVKEWKPEEIAFDALHHAVYAATAGAAYDRMSS